MSNRTRNFSFYSLNQLTGSRLRVCLLISVDSGDQKFHKVFEYALSQPHSVDMAWHKLFIFTVNNSNIAGAKYYPYRMCFKHTVTLSKQP